MVDKNEKALILSKGSKALTEGGDPKKKRLLQAALSFARFSEQQKQF